MKRLVLLITVAAFAFLFSSAAFGAILQVPSAEYTTIQAGIDAASSGDTVQVAAGTYTENITMKSGVVIQGAGQGVSTIDGGGSGYVVTANSVDSTAKLDGFTITNGLSGGMSNTLSSPTVTNCTFLGGSSGSGQMYNNWFSSPLVANCTFSGNLNGGMVNNESSSPTITNCTFSENGNTGGNGGGIYNSSSSPTVTNCTFSLNKATNGGGIYNVSSSPTVTNCIFSRNEAGIGAGMYNANSPSTVVTSCTFWGNSAIGLYNNNSTVIVTNCTFSHNNFISPWDAGGIVNDAGSSVTLTNSIVWGNDTDEIQNAGGSSCTTTYSDIKGGNTESGNINADPKFVDPLYSPGDFHLQQDSPCIDAGNNSAPSLPATDIDGDNRKQDNPKVADTGNGDPPIVDMVADEYVWKVKANPSVPLLLLDGND